jgi:hypothetical protein
MQEVCQTGQVQENAAKSGSYSRVVQIGGDASRRVDA